MMHIIIWAAALILSIACAPRAMADNGGWYKYPVFAYGIDDAVCAADKVLYQSGPSLFSFSTEDGEAYAYTHINKLSGLNIRKIYRNDKGGYLLIAYDDSNIDLLYDNGSVINLPEIRDAQIGHDKTINTISFADGKIVVATAFGVVIYNEDRKEVIESGIYNFNVEFAGIVDGKLLLSANPGSGRAIYASPIDVRHNSIDKFDRLSTGTYHLDITPLQGTKFMMRSRIDSTLHMCDLRIADRNFAIDRTPIKAACTPKPYSGGYYSYNDTQLVLIDNDGNITTQPLPAQLQGQKIAIHGTPTRLWHADADGIGLVDISGDKPTVLFDKMLPEGATTVQNVGFLRWSTDGERLYVSNLCVSNVRSAAPGERVDPQTTNILVDGDPFDASLFNASAHHSAIIKMQARKGDKRMYGDPCWIIEDPDNSDIYYCANNHEGLYVLKYNPQTQQYDEIGKFNLDNAPIYDNWGPRVNDVNIDPQGNLWMGYRGGSAWSILPAAKRRQDPATIKKSDWKEMKKLEQYEILMPDMMSLICRKSRMAFLISGKYAAGVTAVYTAGTYDDPSDDVVNHISSFTDQDGNVFSVLYMSFLLEDRRGAVWVGTNAGVFEITNPEALATAPNTPVKRLKVPRNDGTNYADYLLDTDKINYMALDPAGRKWIATDNSGIFLVNEAGNEILRHYTTDNSPLPSNTVNAIECDPQGNTVYVGTPYGLYSFLSDASPAAESYSQITAYPNPVRPEYSGVVTITGLMDNSIVKIADAAGNVVYQTRSQGGMATWDIGNSAGSPVKSGIYFVHASSGGDGQSSAGATTKIAVIR